MVYREIFQHLILVVKKSSLYSTFLIGTRIGFVFCSFACFLFLNNLVPLQIVKGFSNNMSLKLGYFYSAAYLAKIWTMVTSGLSTGSEWHRIFFASIATSNTTPSNSKKLLKKTTTFCRNQHLKFCTTCKHKKLYFMCDSIFKFWLTEIFFPELLKKIKTVRKWQ